MGTKGAKKQPKTATPSPAAPAVAAAGAPASADAPPSWLDSADPRRRVIGQIVLVGVWLYVAALWLLALDQTFRWGIFGPQLPPAP